MNTLTLAPDIEGLKSRLRSTWMAGDYDRFSRFMENGARSLWRANWQACVFPGGTIAMAKS
jgi:hypothetical protein